MGNPMDGTALLGTVLESHKPLELVILMLGTNDCKTVYDASPEVIGKGIERLILQIQEYQPQAKVLLISPIAPAVQKGNTELLNWINDEIKSLGEQQFFHKDYDATLKAVYGDSVDPENLVVEGGVIR